MNTLCFCFKIFLRLFFVGRSAAYTLKYPVDTHSEPHGPQAPVIFLKQLQLYFKLPYLVLLFSDNTFFVCKLCSALDVTRHTL